jgi:hypothetical protein
MFMRRRGRGVLERREESTGVGAQEEGGEG